MTETRAAFSGSAGVAHRGLRTLVEPSPSPGSPAGFLEAAWEGLRRNGTSPWGGTGSGLHLPPHSLLSLWVTRPPSPAGVHPASAQRSAHRSPSSGASPLLTATQSLVPWPSQLTLACRRGAQHLAVQLQCRHPQPVDLSPGEGRGPLVSTGSPLLTVGVQGSPPGSAELRAAWESSESVTGGLKEMSRRLGDPGEAHKTKK